MPNVEKRFAGFLSRHMAAIAFVFALVLSVFVRYKLLPIIGADMYYYFLPWCETLAARGLPALADGVGIYSVVLQLVLLASAKLPIDTATAIKLFSFVFDYLMAFGVMLIALRLRPKNDPNRGRAAMAAFAGTTLLPLVVLNSAYWGQSESIYVCFLVFTVYCLLCKRWFPAFLLYGLGLSVKLQAIMLLPLLVMLYFIYKRFSLLNFLAIPVVVFLTTLPAILLGAPYTVGLDIYKGLTGYDKMYYVNYPGAPTLSRNSYYENFIPIAAGVALLCCLVMLVVLLVKKLDVQGVQLLQLGAWGVLACAVLLPGMHERYAYPAEVLLAAVFFTYPTLKNLFFAVVFTFTGYCAYASFLFGFWPLSQDVTAVLNLLAFALFTAYLLKTLPPLPAAPPRRGRRRVAAAVAPVEEAPPAAPFDTAALEVESAAYIPAAPAPEVEDALPEPAPEPWDAPAAYPPPAYTETPPTASAPLPFAAQDMEEPAVPIASVTGPASFRPGTRPAAGTGAFAAPATPAAADPPATPYAAKPAPARQDTAYRTGSFRPLSSTASFPAQNNAAPAYPDTAWPYRNTPGAYDDTPAPPIATSGSTLAELMAASAAQRPAPAPAPTASTTPPAEPGQRVVWRRNSR